MVDIANDADFGRKLRAKRGDYIEKIILKVENSYLLSSSFQPFVHVHYREIHEICFKLHVLRVSLYFGFDIHFQLV